MKLSDLKKAIESMEESFGSSVLNNEIFMDFTFENEIMLVLGKDTVTTLASIPEDNE